MSKPGLVLAAVGTLVAWTLVQPVFAEAETLEEALAAAYATNPTLQARRAALRAADEGVPQALSGWRPTVQVTADAGTGRYESSTAQNRVQYRDPRSLGLSAAQPLYRGGRTVAATERAERTVEAERARLISTEQDVLLGAASAYMDVVRDQAVLDLNISNEQVLERQFQASEDRFRVGEITRTDVAQAEARLARATAERIQAESNLQTSRAAYTRAIGHPPEDLSLPQSIVSLPGSLDDALVILQGGNPTLRAADATARAAQARIDEARGELLPTVNLEASASKGWETQSPSSRTESVEAKLTLRVPLYQAGAEYSRLREARHLAGQRRIEVDETRLAAIEAATRSWETLESAQARIQSLLAQIEASEIALEGVQREAEVGARTVLDVLDAEQELLDARVEFVRAQRDVVVAAYQVRAAIGGMTARDLGLDVELYDETENYRMTRDRLFGGRIGGEGENRPGAVTLAPGPAVR